MLFFVKLGYDDESFKFVFYYFLFKVEKNCFKIIIFIIYFNEKMIIINLNMLENFFIIISI